MIGAHIAKSILAFVSESEYETKIFIDKMDKKTIDKIKKEIKSFHIKYKKIRGIADQLSVLIRLVDTVCGAIRDLSNKNVANSYKKLFNRLVEV